MIPIQYQKLARLLVNYSTNLKPHDVVLLDLTDTPPDFAIALVRAAREAKAIPIVELHDSRVSRELIVETDARQAGLQNRLELHRVRQLDAYISIRGNQNASENSGVPAEKMSLYSKALTPVRNHRLNHTNWCVLRWPTPGMAQAAGMSTEVFEGFYFDVCTMDYAKMGRAMGPLEKLMAKTDLVRLVAPGTDLSFSIKGIGAKMCKGDRNIPDGEVFSCPTKFSVNGVIQFNTPTLYSGTKFENVKLELNDGKIVSATSNNTKRLNEILDTDAGARYIGEFSLGFNPYILSPMCDILFDEKIAGSLHFTPGQAYEDCGNGNKSAIHWDMVLIQRKDWGGGEVWFDGKLIRKDGIFLPKELQPLNPQNLK
jgi:aminopeptidase